MDFSQFKDVKQNTKHASKEEIAEKERLKAIISLYLTVLYLVFKNMVYVNSRYVIALHCLERDMYLYKDELNLSLDNKGYFLNNENCFELTKYFIDNRNKYLNNKACNNINNNLNKANKTNFIGYRNIIAHLNAIRNMNFFVEDIGKFDSYFQLYHYVMQISLSRKIDNIANEDDKLCPNYKEYVTLAKTHKTYCKDMVKALNVPFAYNLARYNNLSIDKLFDKNDYRKKAEVSSLI